MKPDSILTEIDARLDAIEDEHDVRILFCCESGSRAWGFASPDSDYDVRFIYVRPRDSYLTIDLEKRRDVIETPLDEVWDVNGWDLRKALKLFARSNPPLYEWLFSPIVYRERGDVAARLRDLAAVVYNATSARYHYLSMATGNFRDYLKGDSVIRKKYFYVLRPILAVRWIDGGHGVVPMEFDRLVEETVDDADVRAEIDALIRLKRATGEKERGAPLPAIQGLIEREVERLGAEVTAQPRPEFDRAALDDIFRSALASS